MRLDDDFCKFCGAPDAGHCQTLEDAGKCIRYHARVLSQQPALTPAAWSNEKEEQGTARILELCEEMIRIVRDIKNQLGLR